MGGVCPRFASGLAAHRDMKRARASEIVSGTPQFSTKRTRRDPHAVDGENYETNPARPRHGRWPLDSTDDSVRVARRIEMASAWENGRTSVNLEWCLNEPATIETDGIG